MSRHANRTPVNSLHTDSHADRLTLDDVRAGSHNLRITVNPDVRAAAKAVVKRTMQLTNTDPKTFVGRAPGSHESAISEALNDRNGRNVPWEWLCSQGPAYLAVLLAETAREFGLSDAMKREIEDERLIELLSLLLRRRVRFDERAAS